MDVYRTEEEQAEAIKKWWQENGKSIIAGIVLGIAVLFGWKTYNAHVITQAEKASVLYEKMLTASQSNDTENIRVYAERIAENFDATIYAIFAKLMLAKLAAESGDLSTAESELRWVLTENTQAEIDHVTRLRLTRVLIALKEFDKATHLLNAPKKGAFSAHYDELQGDIYAKQGKEEEAKQAYEKALIYSVATEEAQSILQMKLANLGKS